MKRFATLAIVMILLIPAFSDAHRSGCHRWHTCPSDTGKYQMQTSPKTGQTIPFCGKSMYLGTDGKCHYYTTKNAPPPATSIPSTTTPSAVNQAPSLQQANIAESAQRAAQIAELQQQIQLILQQIALLQAQLVVLKR